MKDVLFDKAPPLPAPPPPPKDTPRPPVDRGSVPAVPNLTTGEADAARGAGGTSGSVAGTGRGAGGGSAGPDLGTMVNPAPMSNLPREQVLIVRKDGRLSFQTVPDVSVMHTEYSASPDGTTTATSITYHFDQVLDSRSRILSAIFATTAGDFSTCSFVADLVVNCALRGGVMVSGREGGDAPFRFLTPPVVEPASTRAIPLCAGGAFDGGPGVETVIGVDDLFCDSSPATAPDRLRVISSTADPASAVATIDATTGELHYTATGDADGTYTVLTLAAVSKLDGFESWPFTVVIRNHFAPIAQDGPVVEAIRGTDVEVPMDRLFRDPDIDRWSEYTHDVLAGEVISDGAYGHATFDASGVLRYHAIDAVEGAATDRVTVQARDRFGILSRPVTIEFRVRDVTPSCLNGNLQAVAGEAVVVDLDCRLDGPAGYHPLRNVVYSLTSMPDVGRVSEIDPEIGSFTYIPDPDQAGPVTFTFRGENNGALGQGEFTVNVIPSS
ncbi:hypothetical protein [Cnuibacter physcomitrellae]|uniref:hypothetical protein n=1 Tax=Cnuibacter physcomitrellae TaxID=1619308 RepID=UPI0012F4CBCA|nr:hypothetical protein [Cnuibacter physcomitrellae]